MTTWRQLGYIITGIVMFSVWAAAYIACVIPRNAWYFHPSWITIFILAVLIICELANKVEE